MIERSSGILMHITSLPGKYGIGDFGKEAFSFIDFLKQSKQKYWQILPLGVTGYGDSPYQCFSAFAGNPYFLDLDYFIENGLLELSDLEAFKILNQEKIEYDKLYIEKYRVLRIAYNRFKQIGNLKELEIYKNKNIDWIDNYALYMAIKTNFNGISWIDWPLKYRIKDKITIKTAKIKFQDDILYHIFLQYFFSKQWKRLKKYANENGIKIIGDIPIFVATDSADTWESPKMFQFDKKNKPRRVAGCPPDAFSDNGQLWGNVLYNWKILKKDNYNWWIKRVKSCFTLYDVVRIDHFRGFESYWSIPFTNKTARQGKWEKGPGIDLFNNIKRKLGNLDIIAEDLGFLTPKVHKLLKISGYPGMKILEFAFNSKEDSDYLPHKYKKNSVAYTGTHDNQTVTGWYNALNIDDKIFCDQYINEYLKSINSNLNQEINWKLIEILWASNSNLVLAPLQDFLGLDDHSRMNTPSTLGKNWEWRIKKDTLTDELATKISLLTIKYKR
ncbi:4-alpha-glucanotransferase [Cetobacterium sp. 8H]|uniref:4-alpha-glucanotransferase n=1 Tax=Cetobacterium sp. 8H TaxID=2759681 RepID=UPI00163C84B0|nr:4-alpha-glucanotransferase [Cetobacterium sp. 8H]MBC2850111.1 4-alpha-glucanotransferase [Cetobacterium sp. 8H]